MKKLILGLMLLPGLQGLFAQETPVPQAIIREISGTVEVKAPNAAAWSHASRGQALARDTLISTGFKSSALIAIGNSMLTVQPLTRLSLEELTRVEGSEKVDVNLRTCRIRANVKPPANGKTDFTVRSPTATASVRGTVFEFNGIQLQVDEGRVHLAGSDGNGTYVGMGQVARTNIETGRTVSAAETAREELTLPVPAGMDSVPEIIPAGPPLTGEIDAGFEWK
jgi:hypothetical protein